MSATTWPTVQVHDLGSDAEWVTTACPTCGTTVQATWPHEVRVALSAHEQVAHGGDGLNVWGDRIALVDAREAQQETDLDHLAERTAQALVDGGHVADGDEVREAVQWVDSEVARHLANGTSLDAAVGAVERSMTDTVACRVLQAREPAEALHRYAVLVALEGHPMPLHWFFPRQDGGEFGPAPSFSQPSGSSRVALT